MDVFNHPESAMQFSSFGPGASNLFQSSSSMHHSKSTTLESEDESVSVSSAGSIDDGMSPTKSGAGEVIDALTGAVKSTGTGPKQLSADELDRVISLTLSETETIWLLEIPSSSVNIDSNEAPSVRAANARYTEVFCPAPDSCRR